MCLLVLQYRMSETVPLLLAANREEFFDRPFSGPRIQPGRPRVLCGVDHRAGGTWLGVNEFGVLVALTNRPKSNTPERPRSRGALCRELLNCPTAAEAVEVAQRELSGGRYDGANVLAADRRSAAVMHGGDEVAVVDLSPGLYVVANCDMDDACDHRQQIARDQFSRLTAESIDEKMSAAQAIMSLGPDEDGNQRIVLHGPDRGTVCSCMIAIAARPEDSRLSFAHGAPDEHPYEDLSAQLRDLLCGSRCVDA